MIRRTITTVLMSGLIAGLVAGCSGSDEYIFDLGPAGPNTEKTLKNLPEGLLPDKTKARHSSETLAPDQ